MANYKSKFTGEQVDALLDKVGQEGDTSASKWTGHADVEGLKAIGWTDEDIAYYQENGVNWNEEDDEIHKVSEDNKALYRVLTADNIQDYKDRIVYLPKIDYRYGVNLSQCRAMVAIPLGINSTSFNECFSLVCVPPFVWEGTDCSGLFKGCYSLTSVALFDTSQVTSMYQMFSGCYSLVDIPQFDISNVTTMSSMFYYCNNLTKIPKMNTSSVKSVSSMFNYCASLMVIPEINVQNCSAVSMFSYCVSLKTLNMKGLTKNLTINSSLLLSKESLLYIINNEAATSTITIKLASYTYSRLYRDADVVAALAAHPNISLSK